ncbi:hypothetical protein MBANPS3_000727 [Mucor bainieri]
MFLKQTRTLLKQPNGRVLATSNEGLVQKLLQASIITKERVVQAMTTVDRKDFCPRDPYEDSPQGIGYGVTISAPSVLFMESHFRVR